jgi:hypothetical protein
MTTDANLPRPPVDDRLLDRLVDGEVGTDERAGVLAALDAQPDSWRRCALAFLEAQAWRACLGTTVTESPAASAPRSRHLRPARYGAVAAAFVVAFVAGFLTRGGPGGRSTLQHAQDAPFAMQAAQNDLPATATPRSATARSPGRRAAAVRGDSHVRLPIFEAGDADGAGVSRQPSALPEYVRKQLERQGYEVEGDRRVLSVALDDGRSVTVPVERLKYRFVGYRVH